MIVAILNISVNVCVEMGQFKPVQKFSKQTNNQQDGVHSWIFGTAQQHLLILENGLHLGKNTPMAK